MRLLEFFSFLCYTPYERTEGEGFERMRNEMKIPAYAKINLFLEVTGRRKDGYHELDTVMQTVSLCDELTVGWEPEGEGISIFCKKAYIPQNADNIVWKCAERFFDATGKKGRVDVNIVKRIPVSAGLGGGSADGAALFKALNALSGAGLSVNELCAIGAQVGADIPFLIAGGCAKAAGIGEKLTPLGKNKLCLVIAVGGRGSQTPAAYKALDAAGYEGKRSSNEFLAALDAGKTKEACALLYNAFESVIFKTHPEIGALKKKMIALGADGALMSGSGSSVFGLFSDRESAKKACGALREEGYFACAAHSVGG